MGTTKYTLYGVQRGSTIFGSITDQSLSPGTTARGEATSGQVYSSRASVYSAQPMASFTSYDIGAGITMAMPLGAVISDTYPFTLFLQQIANGGVRSSSSIHAKDVATIGLLVPRRISCQHQGDATMSFDAYFCSDGTNAPVARSFGVSLPAGLVEVQAFTLGPVTIGGVALTNGVQSIDIDTGFSLDVLGSGSDIYPSHISVKTIEPRLTVTMNTPEYVNNTIFAGQACTHANTTVYLRRRYTGGQFYGNVSAVHAKFTMAGIATINQSQSSRSNEAATSSITIRSVYDGTNAPLLAYAGQTIA